MFILSKLLSAITQPMFGLALIMLAAFIGMGRWPHLARSLLGLTLVVLVLLGFEAVPNALLRPLEMRYATPSADTVASQVGVIVLGGSFKSAESMVAHGQVPLGESAERLTQAVVLLHKHPEWALVFSGGVGRLLPTGLTEAQMARQFFLEQGIAEDRIQLESRSRTTRENAQQVAQLLGPRCQQPWLLITSAWHMPRAMEEFQKTGCRITPYPADYRTGNYTPWTEYSLAHSLVLWQVALHEWLGILAYRTTR